MIISASRRSDIPAFYGEWLMNRLKAGEVLVRNPMQAKQVSRIMLSAETVDALVFWTKNPANFLSDCRRSMPWGIPTISFLRLRLTM